MPVKFKSKIRYTELLTRFCMHDFLFPKSTFVSTIVYTFTLCSNAVKFRWTAAALHFLPHLHSWLDFAKRGSKIVKNVVNYDAVHYLRGKMFLNSRAHVLA